MPVREIKIKKKIYIILSVLALASGLYLLFDKPHPPSTDPMQSTFRLEMPSLKNPKDSAPLILVPEGEYPLGNPPVKTKLKAFYIYRFEVTNRQFNRFVKESGYKPQGEWHLLSNEKTQEHPVCEVTFGDARAYARWAGGDLPTRAQWEAAARGPQGYTYPWGNQWNPDRANGRQMKTLRHKVTHLEKVDGVWLGTLPVGSFPHGASPFGVMDMAGNVAEWCRDDSPEEQGKEKTLMGGAFYDDRDALKTYVIDGDDPDKWCNLYGFRVVLSRLPIDKQDKSTR